MSACPSLMPRCAATVPSRLQQELVRTAPTLTMTPCSIFEGFQYSMELGPLLAMWTLLPRTPKPTATLPGLPARTKGAVASIIFRLPVMSQFFTWMGNLPADRGSMLAVLARGESVGVVPEVRVPSSVQ